MSVQEDVRRTRYPLHAFCCCCCWPPFCAAALPALPAAAAFWANWLRALSMVFKGDDVNERRI